MQFEGKEVIPVKWYRNPLLALHNIKGFTKDDLRPGMQVRNSISDQVGELVADPRNPSGLWPCGDFAVRIQRRLPSGRLDRTYWRFLNIEPLPVAC